jgi:hypothetical protein
LPKEEARLNELVFRKQGIRLVCCGVSIEFDESRCTPEIGAEDHLETTELFVRYDTSPVEAFLFLVIADMVGCKGPPVFHKPTPADRNI